MTSTKIKLLRKRLDEELTNISRLCKSIDKYTRQREEGEGIEKLDSDLYFRAMGSILHDFYSAVEKSFLTIAREIDNEVPAGSSWHSDLLDQMSYDIDGVRPAVISKDLREKLKEYLGFRHIFRNVYGFNLVGNKLDLLLKNLPNIHKCYKKAVSKFLQNMEEVLCE